MHTVHRLIKSVNATHRGLGTLVAFNLICAKAKKTILNVSPAGCGKSSATNTVYRVLGSDTKRYGSVTLSGLHHLQPELSNYAGHIIIDDLAAEKSVWSRVATISALSHLVYSHQVSKYTQSLHLQIENFSGSVALNIQPVLMQSLVDAEEWVSMIRDKVIRYYHLIRPSKPVSFLPNPQVNRGPQIQGVSMGEFKGKLYYKLFAKGLYQWSAARCNEHIPDLLKACAALDNRTVVNVTDYILLDKLMQHFNLEVNLVDTFGFEAGRVFNQNAYYLLVELASFPKVTLQQICVDYKVSMRTAERLINTVKEWCYLESADGKVIKPTEYARKILEEAGVNQKW